MSKFNQILDAEEESLAGLFHSYNESTGSQAERMLILLKKLRLREIQFICSLGFNTNTRKLGNLFPAFGYQTYEDLIHIRNDIFSTDIYKRLSLDNVLQIYRIVKDDPETLQVMQYLLKARLEKVEQRIEETVNSLVIEKYKAEMRAIYNEGIAGIDFTEERLDRQDSGFRALLNEVGMIIESKIIPVGDIFFRNTILPEEKRKILNKGLIPRELVESRLDDDSTPLDEKMVLHEYLRYHRS